MQYMAIVECISSGRLYVNDIVAKGYKPLIINVNNQSEFVVNYRRIIRESIGDAAEFINEDPDFDTFLEKLKKYDIAAVFAGTELGVPLADRLNAALGLKGNDPATTYLRTEKKGMHEALGKAGLRRIETAVVKSESDIRKFWNENDLDSCVMKFSFSAGTVGMKICSNVEDAIKHYREMLVSPNGLTGNVGDSDILIQEYIGGTEYIVNTLSCNGRHLVTDLWTYTKVRAEDGTLAYDYVKLIKNLEPGMSDAMYYVYSVLDAVDMKWGICHTEIKIDKKGPVLIEVNARPMGLGMTSAYFNEILGHHQTDLAIDTYLDPTRFDSLILKPYNPLKYALMKIMIVPEDIRGSFAPTFVISNMIRSTREILFFGKEGIHNYPRTVDLDTTPMAIKMANSDYGELMKDYELIRAVESKYFSLFYTIGEDLEAQNIETDIDALVKRADPNRRVLLVTDEGRYSIYLGKKEKLKEEMIFDGAIYAQCGACSAMDRYKSIFWTMHNLRSGGLFVAIPESYKSMRYGSVEMDMLMNIAGVRILLPIRDAAGIVYGVKN